MKPPRRTPAWSQAVRQKDSPERERFLEAHVELVRYLATRVASRLPPSVELGDLIHDGVVGLLDAVERYDPRRAVRFRTYAETRIRGAMLDGLRRKDWRPRSVRQLQRDFDAALSRLGSIHHRAASEEEIASAMGLGLGDYRALLVDLGSGPLLSLDELGPGGTPPEADRHAGPHGRLERRELVATLAEEIGRLPERERRILELYYFEELNMKEVGAVLGVTESRVCQLHAQAAGRLRVALKRRLHAEPVSAGAEPAGGRR